MSMVHCRGCGQHIHDSAVTCPHCGAPQGVTSMAGVTAVPPGIQGWSWGAFLFNWIWGIFNGTWLALLCLIPIVGFVMAFVLGFKGREWAWRNKKWESVEHFQRVQRAWSAWAVALTAGTFLIGILAAIAVPAYHDYNKRAAQISQLADQIKQQEIADAAEKAAQAAAIANEAVTKTSRDLVQNITLAADAPATLPVPMAAANNASADLLQKAMTCSAGRDCVNAMLGGANPRRPDILQAAAMRLVAFETAETVDKKLSRELNAQALAKYSANDFNGAVALFSQAAQANPQDVEIRANLGLAYARLDNANEAVNALIAALQLDPRRANAWATLAVAMDQAQLPETVQAALLLTYEFSGNKQKTIEFFRSRTTADGVSESLRNAYAVALKTVESGY